MRLTVLFCLISLSALCEDIYVADQTAGGDTGANCANAHSVSWFNTLGNWGAGAGKISAGDTVHLCGIITNAAIIQAAGTVGSPITLLFESGCIFSNLAWGMPYTGGANDHTRDPIHMASITLHDFIIDGGANGLITASDNGAGKTFTNSVNGVHLPTCTGNVEVKNLNITNLYFRFQGVTNDLASGQGVVMQGHMTNCSVHNCTVSMIGNGLVVFWDTGTSTNIQIYSNNVSLCSWGIAHAAQNASAINIDSKIFKNRIDHFENSLGNVDNHLDGIFCYTTIASQGCTNLQIYQNSIGPNIAGTNLTAAGGSSSILINDPPHIAGLQPGTSSFVNLKVFNNLLTATNYGNWADGFVSVQGDPYYVFNNTYISWHAGFVLTVYSGQGYYFNNLSSNVVEIAQAGGGAYSGVITNSDYNVMYGMTTFKGWSGGLGAWSDWTNTFGHFSDKNGTTNMPALDANYVPLASDTVARGRGTNLFTLATNDYYGNARPSSGAWVVGAFENTNNAADSAVIGVVPSSLNFGTLLTNTTSSLTFYVTNTGTAVLVGQATTSSPFSITSPAGGNYSVAVNASTTVNVSYSPTTAGSDSGTVTCTGGGGATVSLSGSATNAPYFGVTTKISGAVTISGATVIK